MILIPHIPTFQQPHVLKFSSRASPGVIRQSVLFFTNPRHPSFSSVLTLPPLYKFT